MFPAAKIHKMLQFGRTVAGVLGTSDFNRLRTRLAPRVPASGQGTDNLLRLLIFCLVDEDGLLASGWMCSASYVRETDSHEYAHFRQWTIVEKRASCISLKISYSLSPRPSC